MAQWTNIDPNTLLPGDPWTSAKAQAAFENVEAMAEGATGAPRLYGKAAVPRSQQAELAVITGVTAGGNTADNLNYSGSTDGASTSGLTFVSGSTFVIELLSGTIRISAFQVARGSPSTSTTCEVRLLKNEVVVQTFSLTAADGATITQTRSVDIACVPGDAFKWEVRRSSGGNANQDIGVATISASDVYTRIGIPIKASDL